MRAVSDDLRRRTMGVLRLAFLSTTALELLASLALALVAVHLADGLIGGGMDLAVGLFLLILVPEVFQPLRRLGAHYHDKAAAVGAAEAILEVLDAAEVVPADGDPMVLSGPPRIVFDDVSLAYPGGRRAALEAVTLEIAPGEVVALVGASGSGKSSLLALLLGLRRPSAGAIRVDGRTLEGRALIASTAWAGQAVRILSATLRDNLILGRPDADDGAVASAVAAAGLGAVVDRLPEGLETRIGEGGRMLSGGEARRVALARALVRAAPLVLLDEPTANLDADSEAAVLAALRTLASGRTVIVATHSPAVMAMADRVVRLERGRPVAERGDG
jgi:ABC-type transport system involved in cytochrome bd biosynthesis fused ATPase/permease subunit